MCPQNYACGLDRGIIPVNFAELIPKKPEQDSQKRTDDQAGRDGKIEREILLFDGDVTRELAEPRKLPRGEQQANDDQNQAEID